MPKYQITVKPGNSQEKIVATDDQKLIVYLRTKPHDGEANSALIKILAKHLNIPKTSLKITRGQKSRTKIIEF
jgi:uncharacterized protein